MRYHDVTTIRTPTILPGDLSWPQPHFISEFFRIKMSKFWIYFMCPSPTLQEFPWSKHQMKQCVCFPPTLQSLWTVSKEKQCELHWRDALMSCWQRWCSHVSMSCWELFWNWNHPSQQLTWLKSLTQTFPLYWHSVIAVLLTCSKVSFAPAVNPECWHSFSISAEAPCKSFLTFLKHRLI